MKIYYEPFPRTVCEQNYYNYNRVKAFFAANGCRQADDPCQADLILVNTCVHLEFCRIATERMVRRALDRLGGDRDGRQKVILLGCLVGMTDRYGNMANVIPIHTKEFAKLNDLIGATVKIEDIDAQSVNKLGVISCQTSYLSHLKPDTTYIQISQGCNNRCAYCILPRSKGPLVSRPMAEIAADVRACMDRGASEFTLLGDDCGSYGADIGCSIADLLDGVLALGPDTKVNLIYLHPAQLLKHFSRLQKHVEGKRFGYINIPIQSMSDRILKLMNRPYSAAAALSAVEELRSMDDSMWLMTHFIFGFPTETREEFDRLKDVSGAFNEFLYLLYSDYKDTPAHHIEPKVDEAECRERTRLLKEHLVRNGIPGMVLGEVGMAAAEESDG